MTQTNSTSIPNLKVVTLNFWGIRYISKDVDARLGYLIRSIRESDYDLIALQEIWSLNDYQKIKDGIGLVFPYSHYFQNGLVGSGCCVFSRHHIEEVFFHRFSLNGYPYKIQHSDWFAGKLVGLAVIHYHGLVINAYITHLHANYSINFHLNQHSDEYLAHRIIQLFELGQFISKTGIQADLCLLLGDLNTFETEFGYKLLRNHAQLLDAFLEKNNYCDGITCNHKNNKYQPSMCVRKTFPEGIRIDYIMFKYGKNLAVRCLVCKTCFGKIGSTGLNYSDHEGVRAEFEIKQRKLNDNYQPEIKNKIEPSIHYYLDARSVLLKSIDSISASQITFILIAFVCFILLFLFNNFNQYFSVFKNFFLSMIIFFLFIFTLFVKSVEKKILVCSLDSLNVLIKHKNSEFRKFD